MNNLRNGALLSALLLVCLVWAYPAGLELFSPGETGPEGSGNKVRIKIDGMTCGGCESKVQAAVTGVKGVENVVVNRKEGWADVSYLTASMNPDELVTAVRDAGFHASVQGSSEELQEAQKSTTTADKLSAIRVGLAAEKDALMKNGKYSCCMSPGCDFCLLAAGGCPCGDNLLKGKPVCGECAGGWAAGMGMLPDVDPADVKVISAEDMKKMYKMRADAVKKAQTDAAKAKKEEKK